MSYSRSIPPERRPRGGRWRDKLNLMLATGQLGQILPGDLVECNARHDDWCRIFKGGACNCDVEIEVVRSPRWARN